MRLHSKWIRIVAVALWCAGAPAHVWAWSPTFSSSQMAGGTDLATTNGLASIRVNPAATSYGALYLAGASITPTFKGDYQISAAVIDSQTSPMAMGVDYTYARSFAHHGLERPDIEHNVTASISEYYEEVLHVGVGFHYNWYGQSETGASDQTWNLSTAVILPLDEEIARLTIIGEDLWPNEDSPLFRPFAGMGLGLWLADMVAVNVSGGGRWNESNNPFEAGLSSQITIAEMVDIGAFGKWLAYDNNNIEYGGGAAWHDDNYRVAAHVGSDRLNRWRAGLSFEMRLLQP